MSFSFLDLTTQEGTICVEIQLHVDVESILQFEWNVSGKVRGSIWELQMQIVVHFAHVSLLGSIGQTCLEISGLTSHEQILIMGYCARNTRLLKTTSTIETEVFSANSYPESHSTKTFVGEQ